MKELLEILENIDPDINYEAEDKLIDNGCLDSLSILSLVTELEDAFEIEIKPVDLIPTNFNSAKAMWSMIERLQKED